MARDLVTPKDRVAVVPCQAHSAEVWLPARPSGQGGPNRVATGRGIVGGVGCCEIIGTFGFFRLIKFCQGDAIMKDFCCACVTSIVL